MLRISKLTDYGTLILAHMAGLPDRVHSATGLAETLGLGLPTVSKVLKTLGRHALVTSQRGAHGALHIGGQRGRCATEHQADVEGQVRFRQFAAEGIVPVGNTPEQYTAFIEREIAKWAKVVQVSAKRKSTGRFFMIPAEDSLPSTEARMIAERRP